MGGICSFFGHRDTQNSEKLEETITEVIRGLIERGIDEFWCGEYGTFDWICRHIVFKLKKEYPFISAWCVCAYNPSKYPSIRQQYLDETYDGLIYNDEIANGPPVLSILRRNKYIIKNANVVICYVVRKKGGAFMAMKQAEKAGIEVINIANLLKSNRLIP